MWRNKGWIKYYLKVQTVLINELGNLLYGHVHDLCRFNRRYSFEIICYWRDSWLPFILDNLDYALIHCKKNCIFCIHKSVCINPKIRTKIEFFKKAKKKSTYFVFNNDNQKYRQIWKSLIFNTSEKYEQANIFWDRKWRNKMINIFVFIFILVLYIYITRLT